MQNNGFSIGLLADFREYFLLLITYIYYVFLQNFQT